MEKKSELQRRAVYLVAEQIINMLVNNVLHDNGTESFEGWCEGGDVFFYGDVTEQEVEAATGLLKKVAPVVDELTYNYINYGY